MQEVITLYHLVMALYGSRNKGKNIQTTKPYQRVSEATNHHAETRDPPTQDPRDHMAQAIDVPMLGTIIEQNGDGLLEQSHMPVGWPLQLRPSRHNLTGA